MSAESDREQLLTLLQSLSYRRGVVTLASGKTSDFFIDCKQTVLTAQGHALVGSLMLSALRQLPIHEAVAGVALGGCPLASAVSLISYQQATDPRALKELAAKQKLPPSPLRALYIRKAAKDHGTKRLIEGIISPGMKIAMVEDVITTGGSTLRAVEVIKEAGAEVVGVAVLVDRLEGGAERLRAAGLEVVSLFTRNDFVDQYSLSTTLSDTVADY